MKRVLVSDSLAKEGLAILQAAEGIQVDVKTGLKPEELKAIVGDYDALVVRSRLRSSRRPEIPRRRRSRRD